VLVKFFLNKVIKYKFLLLFFILSSSSSSSISAENKDPDLKEIISAPDPRDPKFYGSFGSGFRTLVKRGLTNRTFAKIARKDVNVHLNFT
jgi:hypothetical protein